ncbi:MAG: alpha/beta-hydrolase family protein [Candidatus Nanopelagicales bacterium]
MSDEQPLPETDAATDGDAGSGGTATGVVTAEPSMPEAPPRRRRRRPNFLGLVGALLTFGMSITPSLLPRPWLYEGIICGIGAALGYGVGLFISWFIRRFPGREPGPRAKRIAWRTLAVLGPVLFVYWLLLGVGWQNEVRTLVGEDDEGLSTAVIVGLVTIPAMVVAILVGRGIRLFFTAILRGLGRFLPRWLSAGLSVVIVAGVIYFAVTGVLFRSFVALMNNIYDGTNASTVEGIVQPTSPARSGSPASLAPWQTLGMEGRNFVARGPSVEQLSAFNGRPAQQPIRVYVGLDTAPTAQERAALAVKELERTGAFDRGLLVVAGTTGTGWLEPQTVDTIEYEWNGDDAIVGIQYSFLPSWISTLVDVDRARDAGTALYDAVYAKWLTLPADKRPKLVAYGLSLGSFSMQSPFSSAQDLATRTQGAVFVGSPNFSQPWGQISAEREPGSPQWKPVYQAGKVVRFAGVPADLAEPAGSYGPPRVAYVQHANDPVVWWSPALLIEEPDWLVEPPGPGRTPTMRWYPVLTFLQVTVDQFVGVDVPDGQGHNYGGAMPAVMAAVTSPPQWSAAKTEELTQKILTMPIE